MIKRLRTWLKSPASPRLIEGAEAFKAWVDDAGYVVGPACFSAGGIVALVKGDAAAAFMFLSLAGYSGYSNWCLYRSHQREKALRSLLAEAIRSHH